ncbi:phage tail tip lysozyme [Paracoccus sp. CPCC 101403]|uniref:Phage tail tip lysozyme n=1 Tax=Paracoccus broussonetiae TaxID=3075834 RepID=A0ABU3EAE9_9RHOB|nr:phage tail tip lysozyme [Paracoccus sp. CPCC 101403]MDT1061197.1 phage tail tip lysozyme [Paracoccus sp. CPCC 101403]
MANALSPDFVYSSLIDRGLSPEIAQGFVMNALDESGLNPGINEQNPTVAGSRGGYGLFQWTGPRRRSLEAYAAQKGVPVSDPGLQLDFLLTELNGPESRAWSQIQKAGSAGEAGAAIVNSFLRPAESHRSRREAEYLGDATFDPNYQPGRSYAPASEGMDYQGQRSNAFQQNPLARMALLEQMRPQYSTQLQNVSGPTNALAPVAGFYGDWLNG